MKTIVTSLGMIVFVAAIVAGGTGAFFSDTETSTGNTFTAGAIDLKVDSEQHYNNMICVKNQGEGYSWVAEPGFTPGVGHYPAPGTPCFGSWEAADLGAQTFFGFTDIKPGDEGENTISLHVTSNPAWACVDVSLTENDDATCVEPENSAEGVGVCGTDGAPAFDGELAENMKFAAWLDQGSIVGWQGKTADPTEGDNKWLGRQSPEALLFSNETGAASDVLGGVSYTLAAPNVNGGTPMTPNQTNYIGLQWCAGTQTVGATTITCDGTLMGNDAQTDTMKANIAFRVEQSRNNPNFRCVFPRPVLNQIST